MDEDNKTIYDPKAFYICLSCEKVLTWSVYGLQDTRCYHLRHEIEVFISRLELEDLIKKQAVYIHKKDPWSENKTEMIDKNKLLGTLNKEELRW